MRITLLSAIQGLPWCFLLSPTDNNVAGPSKPAAPAMSAKPAAAQKAKAPAAPKAKPAAKPAAAAAPAEGGIKIKKPSNAYMAFVNSKRAEVKGESSKGCHAGCPAACLRCVCMPLAEGGMQHVQSCCLVNVL